MTTAEAREAKVIGGFNNLADRFQRWYSGSIPWSDVELAKVALIAAVRAEERARIVAAVRKDGPRLRNMGSYWVNAVADFIEADAVPERRQEGV